MTDDDLCPKSNWPCHHHAGDEKRCPDCGHLVRVVSGFLLSGEWVKHTKDGRHVK